jgi:PleD family two-component response regulator
MAQFHRAHAASTILIVDSDALMLTAIGGALDMQGHKVVLARTEQVAQQALQSQVIDLIVLSIDELTAGCEFAARLRSAEANADIPIVFIVPEMASHWSARLQEQGGVFCILRSLDPHDLIDLVDRALWMPHIARRRAAPPSAHVHKSNDWVKLD